MAHELLVFFVIFTPRDAVAGEIHDCHSCRYHMNEILSHRSLRTQLRPAWTDCTFYLPQHSCRTRTPLIITFSTQSWNQTLTYPNTKEKLTLLGKIFFWNCHHKKSPISWRWVPSPGGLQTFPTCHLCKVTLGMVTTSIASDSFCSMSCTKNKIKRNPKAIRPNNCSTFANFQKQAPNTNTKQFWPEPSFKYSIPWTSFVLLVPHWPKAATQFTDHGMTFHLTSTPASG